MQEAHYLYLTLRDTGVGQPFSHGEESCSSEGQSWEDGPPQVCALLLALSPQPVFLLPPPLHRPQGFLCTYCSMM